MSTKMIKSYVKQSLAFMVGDTDIVKAERNWRRSVGYVKSQLATLDSKQPDYEISVEEAETKLKKAKYNGNMTSGESYLRGIKDAKVELEHAENKLAELEESREFFKGLLEEFEKEEPIEA